VEEDSQEGAYVRDVVAVQDAVLAVETNTIKIIL